MPLIVQGNFGQTHSGRSCQHVFVISLHTSLNLFPRRDMRQNLLIEDLLEHYDDGVLCGASMFLDRGAECSCLLQDLHHVGTSIPVPLNTYFHRSLPLSCLSTH